MVCVVLCVLTGVSVMRVVLCVLCRVVCGVVAAVGVVSGSFVVETLWCAVDRLFFRCFVVVCVVMYEVVGISVVWCVVGLVACVPASS